MNDTDIAEPAESAATEQKINWGGIAKGALIVTGVALACVAVGYIGYGLASYAIAHSTVAASIAHGAVTIATGAWHLGLAAAHSAGVFLGNLSSSIGLTGFVTNTLGVSTPIPAAIAQTATNTVGLATGIGAAAVAAPTALKAITAIHPTITVPVEHVATPHDYAANLASSDAMHQAAHTQDMAFKVGTHAAHHEDHASSKSWVHRVGDRPAASIVPDQGIKPRAESFTAQADADKAASAGQQASVA